MRIFILPGLSKFSDIYKIMEDIAENIARCNTRNTILLVEHDHIYTCGTSPRDTTLPITPNAIYTNRGGGITYHGPGQRVIYPIIRIRSISSYISWLCDVILSTCRTVLPNIQLYSNYEGIWTKEGLKIASIGIKVKKSIAYHGAAININSDLRYFQYIHPCGMPPSRITSIHALGSKVSMKEFDDILLTNISSYVL